MVLQAGSTLAGNVKSVTRVGFGLRHETAGLDLEFNQITSPGGETIPVSAQVAEVDNGRDASLAMAAFKEYDRRAVYATG